MPYPVAHVMFFVFCICAIAVYTTLVALLRRELSARNIVHILLLLFVGAFFALFPDIATVYNILVNGTMEHTRIGPIPTHSLLFSSSAILFGTLIGYMLYREFGRAVYMDLLLSLHPFHIYCWMTLPEAAYIIFIQYPVERSACSRIWM